VSLRILDSADLEDLRDAIVGIQRLNNTQHDIVVRHAVLMDSNGEDVGVVSYDSGTDRWQVNLS
jgi:hypothetical protein